MEGATLNPADKDSVKQAVSHWIVELGELESTFKKSDIDHAEGVRHQEDRRAAAALRPGQSRPTRGAQRSMPASTHASS